MSVTIKAFLQKPGETKAEIRRFTVPVDVSTNYTYMERKVAEIFPNLKRADIELQWQDPDGDFVVFSSDEELIGALSFRKDDVFRLYVKEKVKKTGPSGGEVHPGVLCDGCNSNIRGARYKCCVCPDYDLCSDCNIQSIHEEHEMFKIPKPKEMGPGGPWGFAFGANHPPPHFRRWMNRFMRRWHRNNDCKNKEEQPENNEEKAEQEQEDEYLKGVGENIAAMLDPFGIDVHVDVENNGERGHCGPPRWGPYGGWCGAGGRGKWKGKKCCRGKGKKCEKEECKEENKDETINVQKKVADMDINKDGVDGPDDTPMADSDAREFEWTLLKTEDSSSDSDKTDKTEEKTESKSDKPNENDVEEDGDEFPQFPGYPHLGPSPHPGPPPHPGHPHMGPFGPHMGPPHFMGGFPGCIPPRGPPHGAYSFPGFIPPQGPQHPTGKMPAWPKDPKVGESLLQMLQMGFNNENGWLSHLLEENEGDIGKVLDAIKAGYRPDGKMA